MGKLMRLYGVPVLAALAAVFLVVFYHGWQHYLAVKTGSLNTAGTPPNYNFWSGFGSVFPWEMGFFVGVWTRVYQQSRQVNCHTHGCWRIGSYPVGSYRVCKKHHFEVTGSNPTITHLQDHYQETREDTDGRPGSDTGGACCADSGEHGPVPERVSGIPGNDRPADHADHPQAARK